MTKRTFDILVAASTLLFLAPLLIVLAIIIRASSKGPAVFAQTRVGRNEAPFTCYKLRTMYSDTANRPTHEIAASAVTPVGAVLRRTKLDEFPQLYNVLKGDMSLVGPRPCLPQQTELVDARRKNNVFGARPGITGLAQVLNVDMSVPERLAVIDRTYIETRTFAGDLKLILATLTGSGRGIDRTA